MISENFEENRDFFKILTRIEIFEILPKFKSSKILIEIDIFANIDQNQDFSKISTKTKILKILTEIEIFDNFDPNRIFRKF